MNTQQLEISSLRIWIEKYFFKINHIVTELRCQYRPHVADIIEQHLSPLLKSALLKMVDSHYPVDDIQSTINLHHDTLRRSLTRSLTQDEIKSNHLTVLTEPVQLKHIIENETQYLRNWVTQW